MESTTLLNNDVANDNVMGRIYVRSFYVGTTKMFSIYSFNTIKTNIICITR